VSAHSVQWKNARPTTATVMSRRRRSDDDVEDSLDCTDLIGPRVIILLVETSRRSIWEDVGLSISFGHCKCEMTGTWYLSLISKVAGRYEHVVKREDHDFSIRGCRLTGNC
jgi:hypothetical protein